MVNWVVEEGGGMQNSGEYQRKTFNIDLCNPTVNRNCPRAVETHPTLLVCN